MWPSAWVRSRGRMCNQHMCFWVYGEGISKGLKIICPFGYEFVQTIPCPHLPIFHIYDVKLGLSINICLQDLIFYLYGPTAAGVFVMRSLSLDFVVNGVLSWKAGGSSVFVVVRAWQITSSLSLSFSIYEVEVLNQLFSFFGTHLLLYPVQWSAFDSSIEFGKLFL